jgi:hypothetical protein
MTKAMAWRGLCCEQDKVCLADKLACGALQRCESALGNWKRFLDWRSVVNLEAFGSSLTHFADFGLDQGSFFGVGIRF